MSTALTITGIGGLASSATFVAGFHAAMVDNSTNNYRTIYVYLEIKLGTSPSAGSIQVFGLRRDDGGTPIAVDGISDSAGTFNRYNAEKLGHLQTKSSPSTGDLVRGFVILQNPGPHYTIGIAHNTGVNLDSTDGNHKITVIGGDAE